MDRIIFCCSPNLRQKGVVVLIAFIVVCGDSSFLKRREQQGGILVFGRSASFWANGLIDRSLDWFAHLNDRVWRPCFLPSPLTYLDGVDEAFCGWQETLSLLVMVSTYGGF
jgi:hypothetical protein